MKLSAVLPLVTFGLALTAVVKDARPESATSLYQRRDWLARHSSWLIAKLPV